MNSLRQTWLAKLRKPPWQLRHYLLNCSGQFVTILSLNKTREIESCNQNAGMFFELACSLLRDNLLGIRASFFVHSCKALNKILGGF